MWVDVPSGRYRPRHYDGRLPCVALRARCLWAALARCLDIMAIRVAQLTGLAGRGCPAEHIPQRVIAHLPPIYAEWQANHADPSAPPTRYSPTCPAGEPVPPAAVRVTHPIEGDSFLPESGAAAAHQRIALVSGRLALGDGGLVVDDRRVERAAWPYHGVWTLARGLYRVEAVVQGTRSAPVVFDVRRSVLRSGRMSTSRIERNWPRWRGMLFEAQPSQHARPQLSC